MPDTSDIDSHFTRVVDALADKFTGVHDRDTVVRVVNDVRTQLEGHARVTAYLPVLTTRHATDLLAGRAPAHL